MRGGFNNKHGGFSIIELLIAFTIITITLIGAVQANFGAAYWSVTTQTGNEALFKTKTLLENVRATAQQDFYRATSSLLMTERDEDCNANGLCYFSKITVSDISSCAKYADTHISWHVDRYPTTTIGLSATLMNLSEVIALGGDCLIHEQRGIWEHIGTSSTTAVTGVPTGLDVLHGIAFVTTAAPPYLVAVISSSTHDCIGCTGPYNGLDVAYDTATGRTYAYVAATTTRQLQIVDVTDPTSPTLIASSSLAGVIPGADSQGWRIAYYERKVYITTRSITGPQPEFHVFDVHNPAVPVEIGTGFNLNTSVYGMAIRDQYSGGSVHRFAYLATTLDENEIHILDVTDPLHITTPVKMNLPDDGTCINKPDAKALTLSGNTLYVGREYNASSCSSLPELYALDISDPYDGVAILAQEEIGEHVYALQASGDHLFLGTKKGTRESLYVYRNDPLHPTPLASTSVDELIENGIDLDGDVVYTISNGSPTLLRILHAL